MRKLFKKSLACILTAIICVSLCVAAVPASATTPSYATNEIVAKAGETVTIDFAVSNFINVKGAMIKFFLPDAVASVTEVKLNGAELAAWNDDEGTGYYQVNGNEIKFLSLFGYAGELEAVETLTFNVTAVIADDAEVKEYTYPAPEFQITENGESLVDVTGTFAKFEVAPAVVEPIYDDNFRFRSVDVTLASSIALNFNMNKTDADAFDSAYVVFEKPVYNADGTLQETMQVVVDFSEKTQSLTNASRYALTFPALYPQDLGATITATPYGVKDGQAYVGRSVGYCILTFVKNNYTQYSTLFANMLNYGTVVQRVNNYNTVDMIDAKYSTLVGNEDWKKDITEGTPELTSIQTSTNLTGQTVKIRSVAVALADKVIVKLRTANMDNTLIDFTAGYQMKITYTNAAGDQELYYDITSEYVDFDALSASEMSVAYTAVIVDADGEEVSNTLVSSIESFCQRNQSEQTIALMKYGNSVAALNG